ncbi:type 1 glutamine amidotransferase family protein [Rubeoparvulum massiliense]|uniref:hypothetical protein n=1 Tax=Rubeoparvulum massiliense TaxID=1631346 RepID=UPI00069FB12D|nr:hypothetical protein [Rubeoparvulum massiliense]
MQISLVIFDDFTDLDLFLPWDLLNRVAWESVGGLKDWQVDIIGTKESHVSMSGLHVPTTGRLDNIIDSDVVILTSGSGVNQLIQDQEYLNRIKLDPQRQLIGAIPVRESFVVNQNIATAASCFAAQELVSWIIREKVGQAMVDKVMNSVKPVSILQQDYD